MAARWTSRVARPPVVAASQLGSNRNVPSRDLWMIKTMRRTAHKIVLSCLLVWGSWLVQNGRRGRAEQGRDLQRAKHKKA